MTVLGHCRMFLCCNISPYFLLQYGRRIFKEGLYQVLCVCNPHISQTSYIITLLPQHCQVLIFQIGMIPIFGFDKIIWHIDFKRHFGMNFKYFAQLMYPISRIHCTFTAAIVTLGVFVHIVDVFSLAIQIKSQQIDCVIFTVQLSG